MARGTSIPPAQLALYQKIIDTHPDAEMKGAAAAYTSVNGHMFSFMTKEGALALRMSPEDQAAFVKKHKTKPVIQYGATMRGYVEVPASILKKTAVAKKYFAASYDYVSSLEPKATTRKKTTKKKSSTKKKTTKKKVTTKKAASKKKTTKKKVTKKKVTKKKRR